jgi:hypothetical protein
MPRFQTRRFTEGRPRVDIRAIRRELGPAVLTARSLTVTTTHGVHHLELEHVPRPPFGGVRAYLRCPQCDRRADILYLVRHWACRTCHGLAHWSEAITPMQRRVRRLVRLRERMGQAPGGSIMGEMPVKPKRMRWRTYERLAVEFGRLSAEHRKAPVPPSVLAWLGRYIQDPRTPRDEGVTKACVRDNGRAY